MHRKEIFNTLSLISTPNIIISNQLSDNSIEFCKSFWNDIAEIEIVDIEKYKIKKRRHNLFVLEDNGIDRFRVKQFSKLYSWVIVSKEQTGLDDLEINFKKYRDVFNMYLLNEQDSLLLKRNNYLIKIAKAILKDEVIVRDCKSKVDLFIESKIKDIQKILKEGTIEFTSLDDLLNLREIKIIPKIELTEEVFNLLKRDLEIIPLDEKLYAVLYFNEPRKESEDEIYALNIIYLIDRLGFLLNLSEKISDSSEVATSLEKKFFDIEIPLALISYSGDLLLHNSLFLKLNLPPRECIKISDKEQIEVNDTIYNVLKEEIDDRGRCVYKVAFINSKQYGFDSYKKLSSTELGIITSSLAHELNNPIAGILATTELLMLEDEFDKNDMSDLLEMKKSGERCKQLIDVFLGFSKQRLDSAKVDSLKEAFQEALGLLRFRMIESNALLEIDFREDDQDLFETNISVISMIFYLIFSEILTIFSKTKLIYKSEDNQLGNDKILKGKFIRNTKFIKISFDEYPLDLQKRLKETKLLQYLLSIEKMSLTIKENNLILNRF